MEKRVFLIVLDSFGIGAEPDAAAFGDEGTNTLGAIANHPNFNCPNLKKLGLFNIDGVTVGEKDAAPIGSFARLQEQSMGKDTTIGHWEIAGVVSPRPLPTFPDGFPDSLIHEFEEKTGHKVLCNKPYSGTQVLKDYGEQATMDCTTAASRGLGKGLVPMIFVFLGSCVFRVAWIYTVFAHFHTIRSLYMLYPFSWVLTGAAEIAYFLYCYKKYVKPLDASHAAE